MAYYETIATVYMASIHETGERIINSLKNFGVSYILRTFAPDDESLYGW